MKLLGAAQAQQLLLELQLGNLKATSLQDKHQARICTALAEADKCLVDGSYDFLELLHHAVASVAQLAIQGWHDSRLLAQCECPLADSAYALCYIHCISMAYLIA